MDDNLRRETVAYTLDLIEYELDTMVMAVTLKQKTNCVPYLSAYYTGEIVALTRAKAKLNEHRNRVMNYKEVD